MPTYADLWNERLRATGQSGPSNPVRLTISKGDYVWDPHQSRFRYEEKWEEEHLMEAEEIDDRDHLGTPRTPGTPDSHSRGPSPGPIGALQPLAQGASSAAGSHSPSLWVLDTNTLMSCLHLLKALFAALLTHNVAYAASASLQADDHVAPSPIRLVIPHVVLSELDGLKLTRRADDSGRPVASQAREANHWLLAALQKQKRVPIDASGAHLPEQLWPLFLQPSSHYNRSKGSRPQGSRWSFEDELSCDDQIIKFCVDLKHHSHANVCFCSDDINARTKAERDDIDSLGMRELANAVKIRFADVQSTERKWELVAEALIEQWQYQMSSEPTPIPLQYAEPPIAQELQLASPIPPSNQQSFAAPIANMETVEIDMDTEETLQPPANPQLYPQWTSSPSPPSAVAPPRLTNLRSSPGRGTSDSIHSPQNRTRVQKPTSSHARQQRTALQATVGQEPLSTGSAEALNPQVDWQDLVQQLGPGMRHASKRTKTRS